MREVMRCNVDFPTRVRVSIQQEFVLRDYRVRQIWLMCILLVYKGKLNVRRRFQVVFLL